MIKLYLMEVSPLRDAKCFEQGLALVEPERREKIKKSGQEKSRLLWLAAGLLAAYAAAEAGEQTSGQDAAFDLSYHSGRDSDSTDTQYSGKIQGTVDCIYVSAEAAIKRLFSLSPTKIEKTPDGKPYYADRQGLFLSLSHSGEYAACAVSDAPIGVDIQKHQNVKYNVWERISCPSEKAAFSEKKNIPVNGKREYLHEEEVTGFYRLWTAKEACVKYTGRGLSKDFRELFTDFEKGEIKDTVTEERWQLYFANGPEGYSLAICTLES